MSSPLLVAIEGNLATGKRSAVNYLQEYFGDSCLSFLEPLEKWRNFASPLSTMEQIQRWGSESAPFNLLESLRDYPEENVVRMCLEKFNNDWLNQTIAQAAVDKKIAVSERCMRSAIDVFASQARDHVTDVDKTFLTRIYNILGKVTPPLDLVIFLEASPDVTFNKIKKRARAEEANITKEFVEEIEVKYENLRFKMQEEGGNVAVVHTDGKTTDQINKEVLSIVQNYL